MRWRVAVMEVFVSPVAKLTDIPNTYLELDTAVSGALYDQKQEKSCHWFIICCCLCCWLFDSAPYGALTNLTWATPRCALGNAGVERRTPWPEQAPRHQYGRRHADLELRQAFFARCPPFPPQRILYQRTSLGVSS